MQSAFLLDVDGHEPCGGHHQHGDEARELAYGHREHDEAYEGHAYGRGRQREEASAYAHELQRLLQSLEDGEAFHVLFHPVSVFSGEEQGQGFRQGDEGYASADGQHDGLFHVLVAVLHLEIDIEGPDKHDDGGDGLHQVGYGCLVGGHLLGGFGEACGSLAGSHRLTGRDGEGQHGQRCLAVKA